MHGWLTLPPTWRLTVIVTLLPDRGLALKAGWAARVTYVSASLLLPICSCCFTAPARQPDLTLLKLDTCALTLAALAASDP